jgi:hypothetical protein
MCRDGPLVESVKARGKSADDLLEHVDAAMEQLVALEHAGGTAQVIWIQSDPDARSARTWASWMETN